MKTLNVMLLSDRLSELCTKIEKLPAGGLQTEISIMASDLLKEVQELENNMKQTIELSDYADVIKTTSVYRCEFEFRDEVMSVVSPRGINAFKNGFWLNHERKLTQESDARFWIPPQKIILIIKKDL